VHADQVGLDVFGIGEHHRAQYLDSAPAIILAAAATRNAAHTSHERRDGIELSRPVRVFQNFANARLLSQGRAEIVAGRGSFVDSFPLFGFRLEDYDRAVRRNLDLL